jgi:hypothetical protein
MIGTRYGGRGGFTLLDAIFGGLGFIAGLSAAIYGYTLLPSLALALFVFAMVSYLVGRALPDLITKPARFRELGTSLCCPSAARPLFTQAICCGRACGLR